MPEDVRGLVEAVYGEAALAGLPAAFERNRNEAEGTEGAARSIAGVNLLKPEAGYDGEHVGWAAEARIPTRLGDPTVTLRLACWDGGRLRPMCGKGEDPEHAWALSEVTVRASRVRGVPDATGALGRAAEAAKGGWTRYDEGKAAVAAGWGRVRSVRSSVPTVRRRRSRTRATKVWVSVDGR